VVRVWGKVMFLASSWFLFGWVYFFYAVFGDFEDSFAVGEVGAGDEAGDADWSSGGFAEVDAGVAGVGYYVSADGVDGVAEEDVGFCHDLVCYYCGGVEGAG